MTTEIRKISFIGEHSNNPDNSSNNSGHFNREAEEQEKTISFLSPPSSSDIIPIAKRGKKGNKPSDKAKDFNILDPEFIEKSDILTIDQRVRNFLHARTSNLNILRQRQEELKWMVNNLSRHERKLASNALFNLEKKISLIKNNREIEIYNTAVEPILEHYKNKLSHVSVQCFVSSSPEKNEQEKEKELLRAKFLSIVGKFIEGGNSLTDAFLSGYLGKYQSIYMGNLNRETHSKNHSRSPKKAPAPPYSDEGRCTECQSNNFYCVDESTVLCCDCGFYGERVNLNLAFKDTDRIDLVPRFNYTKRAHMEEALHNYQGKQNTTTISEEILNLLGSETKKNDISSDDLTKRHLYIFLSQNNYGGQYENINLIHHLLTGKPCPDISEYEEIILERNDQIEQIYNTVKRTERKNSLNIYYKLWKICESLNLPVNRDDFCFLKTDLKIKEHDDVCRLIFLRLGWYFIETDF